MYRLKMFIALLLLFAGASILVNHFLSQSVKVHGIKYEYFLSKEEISNSFKQLIATEATDNDLKVLFLISNNSCPPCITNVFHYKKLLDDQEIKNSIVFKMNGQKPSEIHRFAGISGIKDNYSLVDSLDLPIGLQNEISMMYFVNPSKQKIFYKSLIPNNTVTTETYKMELIKDATNKRFWE